MNTKIIDTSSMLASYRANMNLSVAILRLHKTLARRSRLAGNLKAWARHMNHCKSAKAKLSRDAKAVHSLLYCENLTNVKPGT